MSYATPLVGSRWVALAAGAVLALVLTACSSASGPTPSATLGIASQTPAATNAATVRCAVTPNASASATVKWNQKVEGSPTIKVGQAVAFITQGTVGPTVTEGTNGTPAVNGCVDQMLFARVPLVLTFYQPGDYNLFCRKAPYSMFTVVHVH